MYSKLIVELNVIINMIYKYTVHSLDFMRHKRSGISWVS